MSPSDCSSFTSTSSPLPACRREACPRPSTSSPCASSPGVGTPPDDTPERCRSPLASVLAVDATDLPLVVSVDASAPDARPLLRPRSRHLQLAELSPSSSHDVMSAPLAIRKIASAAALRYSSLEGLSFHSLTSCHDTGLRLYQRQRMPKIPSDHALSHHAALNLLTPRYFFNLNVSRSCTSLSATYGGGSWTCGGLCSEASGSRLLADVCAVPQLPSPRVPRPLADAPVSLWSDVPAALEREAVFSGFHKPVKVAWGGAPDAGPAACGAGTDATPLRPSVEGTRRGGVSARRHAAAAAMQQRAQPQQGRPAVQRQLAHMTAAVDMPGTQRSWLDGPVKGGTD